MTDDQLADQLHELKRRNETPLPLIEMFEALLSLDPRLSAKQKRKKSTQIMARALERLERKDASLGHLLQDLREQFNQWELA